MQVCKISKSLDSMEILITATFSLKENSNTQVLKKDILRSTTSRASPLRRHGSFHRGILERKILSPFHQRDVKKGFYPRHWNPDLRLRPPRWSSLRRSSVGFKHHWSIWGTMEPKTTKRKYCKTFYAKRKLFMRLSKDTALNQMDWPRDSTSPSWTRFAACLSMQTWYPSSGPYAAHYAVLIYNNLPHSALDNHKSPNDAYGDSSDYSSHPRSQSQF